MIQIVRFFLDIYLEKYEQSAGKLLKFSHLVILMVLFRWGGGCRIWWNWAPDQLFSFFVFSWTYIWEKLNNLLEISTNLFKFDEIERKIIHFFRFIMKSWEGGYAFSQNKNDVPKCIELTDRKKNTKRKNNALSLAIDIQKRIFFCDKKIFSYYVGGWVGGWVVGGWVG